MSFFSDLTKANKMFEQLDDKTQQRIIHSLENNKKRYDYKERRNMLAKHIYKKDHKKVLELLKQAVKSLADVKESPKSH